MNPAITDVLKSTKAKFVYVAVAIAAVFKFIGDFNVPSDRIGYLGSALTYVWPDVLALLFVVLLVAFRKLWFPPLRRGVRSVLSDKRQNRGYVTIALAVLVAVGAGALAEKRVRAAYYQAQSAIDSRWQVYRYAFGYRYSDSLRARAVEELAAGRPETADRTLARAEKWTFGSPSLSENIKELRALAQSRIELSSVLSGKRSRNQLASLSYAVTAGLTSAYVLNAESDGLRKVLVQRSEQAGRFAHFLESALANCGQHISGAEEAAFRNSCTVVAAEQFDSKVAGCRDASRLFCQRMGLAEQGHTQRARSAHQFVAEAVGADEILAVVGDMPPPAKAR